MAKLARSVPLIVFVACLMPLSGGCSFSKSSGEEVEIITILPSPTKDIIATSYRVYGGGAAGYVYTYVNLRTSAENFDPLKGFVLQGARMKDISLEWTSDDLLTIKYPQPSSVYTQEKEWGKEKKVHIRYETYSVGNKVE